MESYQAVDQSAVKLLQNQNNLSNGYKEVALQKKFRLESGKEKQLTFEFSGVRV